MIKRFSFGIAFAAGLTCMSSAGLINASFEDPAEGAGQFTTGVQIPGWDTQSGHPYGVWHIPYGGAFSGGAPDGLQIGYCDAGSMAQTATDVIGVGTNSISALAGRREDFSAGGFTMELWAGGVEANGGVTGGQLLASVTYDYTQFAPDSWTLETASYVAAANDPNLGKAITVEFVRTALSHQIDVDNVKVMAAPAPEPASMIGLGLGVIAMVRRRCAKRA